MQLFDVKIGDEKRRRVLNIVDNVLSGERKTCFIATLNNEILLKAKSDEEYRDILNGADIRIVDSMGIRVVSLLKGRQVADRITGADLATHILEFSRKKGLRVGVILKDNGFSSAEDVKKTLKGLNLTIFQYNSNSGEKEFLRGNIDLIRNIEVLLVGTGAPQQEQLIWNIKDELPDLRLAIGVGGTIDFWTGKKKRAPVVLRKIGLEWLWRLIIQPNRALRTWNATFVFLWKALIT